MVVTVSRGIRLASLHLVLVLSIILGTFAPAILAAGEKPDLTDSLQGGGRQHFSAARV